MALEFGGNAPFIVLDDADLELAVSIGKYFSCGQISLAINRMIVDEWVQDAFLDRFATRVADRRSLCGRA